MNRDPIHLWFSMPDVPPVAPVTPGPAMHYSYPLPTIHVPNGDPVPYTIPPEFKPTCTEPPAAGLLKLKPFTPESIAALRAGIALRDLARQSVDQIRKLR